MRNSAQASKENSPPFYVKALVEDTELSTCRMVDPAKEGITGPSVSTAVPPVPHQGTSNLVDATPSEAPPTASEEIVIVSLEL